MNGGRHMYKMLSTIIYSGIKLFRLLKIEGKENIPYNHRFIVTCSHKGWVDVIILAISLYPTPVHYMAKQELFAGKCGDRFFRSVKAFPVNRENPGPSALKIPIKLLKENKCVGIFPSGTRTSEDVPLKRGAVTIALKANAPLLPASFQGPATLSDLFKGTKSSVVFGKPMMFDDIKKMDKNEQINEAVRLLEQEMRELEAKH